MWAYPSRFSTAWQVTCTYLAENQYLLEVRPTHLSQPVRRRSGWARDSPGIRRGLRCRCPALPHGGAVEGLSASTKGLLSASPRRRSGSPREDDPIPSAVTSARGDPRLSSRGCSSAESCLQCFFTAAVQVPAGPRSPRAAQAPANPSEPLFSTPHTKRAVITSLSGQGATGIHLDFWERYPG